MFERCEIKALLRAASDHGIGSEVAGILLDLARNEACDADEWVVGASRIIEVLQEVADESAQDGVPGPVQ